MKIKMKRKKIKNKKFYKFKNKKINKLTIYIIKKKVIQLELMETMV